jgi:O-succinylbenzoic acid--CoA ligase
MQSQFTVVPARATSLVADLEGVWTTGAAAVVLPEGDPGARWGPSAPDTVLVLRTSGTTGAPKLVELSDSALEAAVALTNAAVGAAPGDRWLCCLPVTGVGGLMTLLRSRALGTDAVIHERFDVERIRSERRARFVSFVPTMLHRLLEAEVDLGHFDRVLLGGSAADRSLLRRARERGVPLTTTYGMTETCGGVVYDGVPLPGVEVRLGDEGRIAISSPTLMSGYLDDREATDAALQDGWFATNDRGTLDAEGRLTVHGRLDDVIVVGGKKVEPGEVAAALAEHPAIGNVLVRGEPDEEWGQRVVALVVPRGPAPALEEIHLFLEGRLSRHKWPRDLTIVDRLPKS